MKEAIVLAGGFGTRLQSVVKDLPKPMAPINGKPFLTYIFDYLLKQGVEKVILAVHYKKEIIINYYKDKYKEISIEYSIENSPLLTGGAIKKALKLCKEDYVWIINGDTFFDTPLIDMANFALDNKFCLTIASKKMYNFSRYGKLIINNECCIEKFEEKQYSEEGYINGGIYFIKSSLLNNFPEVFSLENDCFPILLRNNNIGVFKNDGYFIDIGIPDDYEKAINYFKEC